MEEQIQTSLFEDYSTSAIEHPFSNRKVVIDGSLGKYSREYLKLLVSQNGGDVISSDPTKGTNFFISSSQSASSKMAAFKKLRYNGFNVILLEEKDIDRIVEGDISDYFVPEEVAKNLHLSIDHYNNSHLIYPKITTEPGGRQYLPNPFYGKNLYLGSGINGNKLVLCQLLGMIGVFSGGGLSDATQIIVLSQDAYSALQKGESHPELIKIQDTYNRGIANWFSFVLTTESELMSWFKERNALCNDSVCERLYVEYMSSK